MAHAPVVHFPLFSVRLHVVFWGYGSTVYGSEYSKAPFSSRHTLTSGPGLATRQARHRATIHRVRGAAPTSPTWWRWSSTCAH